MNEPKRRRRRPSLPELKKPKLPADLQFGATIRGWLPRIAFVVLVAGGIAMAFALYPHELSQKEEPNWIDNIFYSRTVVWAIRMVVFFGCVYVVFSVLFLVTQGLWLTDFGPFKVSETLAKLRQRVEDGVKGLKAQREINEDLARRLEERDEQLAALTEERDELRRQAGTTTEEHEDPNQ